MNKKKWRILLPQPIEQSAVNLLTKAGHAILLPEKCDKKSVMALIPQAHAVILRTGIRIDSEILRAGKNLLTISRTGAGADNVDLKTATKQKIVVTSSLGVNAPTVAEHTVALMLALTKKLPLLDAKTRKGCFKVRYQNHPVELRGKTLGLIGFGRIGREVARICRHAFGMRIIACDTALSEPQKKALAKEARFADLSATLENADIVSVHAPLTEKTQNLIAASALSLLKPSAFLVNCARGGIVNEKSLIKALKEGRIAGAGIDVFAEEPPDPRNELLSLKNVVLTPHSAALTTECVKRMAVAAVTRILSQHRGEKPTNVANPAVLKSF